MDRGSDRRGRFRQAWFVEEVARGADDEVEFGFPVARAVPVGMGFAVVAGGVEPGLLALRRGTLAREENGVRRDRTHVDRLAGRNELDLRRRLGRREAETHDKTHRQSVDPAVHVGILVRTGD